MSKLAKTINDLIELHGLTAGTSYDIRYPAGKATILYTIYRKSDMKTVSKPMTAYGLKRWYAGFIAGCSQSGDPDCDELRNPLEVPLDLY